MIGQTVAHYKIVEALGHGGMGVVYKAEDLSLHRMVALKFIRPGRERTDAAVQRFRREAQAAAALNHPNIVAIYEIGEHQGQLFISMEFVAGDSLAMLMSQGALSLPRALEIIGQVGEALSKAHKRGVVHRDIKPENVLIDEDGRAKILDFGLAKLLGSASATDTGAALGTVAYMPPEQARGERVDHRADIWSMGVLLYEMVTGDRPFRADSAAGTIQAVLNRAPRPVTELRADAPAELDRVLARALAKEPRERYGSASEFLADLPGVLPGAPAREKPQHRRDVDSKAPTQMRSPAPAPAPLGRRQVTVMSCSLSASEESPGTLDPEDLDVPEYEELHEKVVRRYDGHLDRDTGNVKLAYFGFPRAHEDDPRRAVLAGLNVLEGVKRLNGPLGRERSLRLSVRIGVHTGTVVAKADSQADAARIVGDAPSIALQLPTLARPNSFLITEATRRLVEGFFEWGEGRGRVAEGPAESLATYEVLHERAARNRLEAEGAIRGLAPLVGRERELGILIGRWEELRQGFGQVVLLSGEAGIGKSRLALELKKHVARDPRAWLTEMHCSPYHGGSAFHPIIDVLERVVLQYDRTDPPDAKLQTLAGFLAPYGLRAAETVPLFAGLLSIPLGEGYAPLNMPPERQKQKILAALVQITLARAAEQPLLLIMEDLHWADPSTLDFLDLVVDQVTAVPVLVLLTCRPEFRPPWATRSHVAHLPLTRLTRAAAETLVAGVSRGRALPGDLFARIVAKSDGVPLFVEELTKTVLESDQATAAGRLDVPETLQASLMARLDRLGAAKEVAQLGAVLGREFPYDWLRAVSPWDEGTLQAGLDRLVEAELMYRRDLPPARSYQFKHALVEEAAYGSLVKGKRQEFHRRAAEKLRETFPEIESTSPELLAHHFAAGGLGDEAIPYWLKAGERAIQRSANAEAASHLRRGIELLSAGPDDAARASQELPLQMNLGLAVMASRGYAAPESEQAFGRARELCRKLGDPPPTFPVLHGLFRFHLVRGEYQTARDLGNQLASLAEQSGSADLLVEAHWALPTVFFWTGELTAARTGLERGLSCYDPEQHRAHVSLYGQDPKVATLSYLGWVLAILGQADQGVARVQEAVALARKLDHPFSLGFALHCSSIVHQLRRDVAATLERTQEQIAICTELGFPFWASGGAVIQGWALGEGGARKQGAALMSNGLAGWVATGAELARPYYLHMIADAHRDAGRVSEGLRTVEEALSLAAKTGESHYLAELHRLKGELLRLAEPEAVLEAEGSFRRAAEIAGRQGARMWELRAACSLARLWQGTPGEVDGRRRLARVYESFTEGLDTQDLQDAKAVLGA